ncbi:MAG TPA: TRAP transporter large permease [Syntrophorhabdales bacterium]|nr:TRAP transporter large permease [Syntrophorhabdales bacterium]
MSEITVGIIALVFLLGFFLTGIELAFAMALVGVAGFSIVVSPSSAMNLLANDFFDSLASYGFTVVPLFILMGQVAFNAGVARRLYEAGHRFVGHIPGGLAIATVVGTTVFKAICGSVVATVATFASVAIPEMDRYKYSRKLSAGIVATVGTLGVLLPPSVTLIVVGIITQLSIGKLFMAGIIPGLIIAFFFAVVIVGWCKINPQIGPRSDRFTWKERMSAGSEVVWPIVIFLVIIGGFIYGFFSPTEAGSIGAFAVIVLCLVKKDIGFKGFVKSLEEALRSACMVLMLVAASTVLGHFIAVTNIPQVAADWIVSLPMPRSLIMLSILLVYLIGGSFIDDLAFMILSTPIFFPATIKLGYDPLWSAIMIAVTVCIGSVIPPVAICVFVVKNITKTPMSVVYAGVYPFLISLILCMVLMFLFPQLVLYLPSIAMK